MADDMWQGKALRSAAGDLESVRPTALVAWAILVYPEEGNNKNRVASDVLVGLGLGTHNRSSYFVWEEGKPPDWVLEVASPRKQAEDRGYKRRYYAEMGVPEYWMFDPKGDLYPPGIPRLQGLKLVGGEYRPLESRVVDGEWTIRSEVLGLDIRVDGELLRFRDIATGRDVQRRSEVEADLERALAAIERHRAATEAIMNAGGDLESARPKALVARDILVYPEKGNNRNRIAPDVLVALGLGTHYRSSYLVWEEGKPPDWVLEVASPSTKRKDLDHMRCKYAEMGVPEYWLFDPKGDVYPPGTPQLQGLKLVDCEYRPLKSRLVDGEWTIRSEVLGLDIRVDGELLRFRDVATGRDVRRRSEVEADEERAQAATDRAEARAEQEVALRLAAEARVAELEAALKGGPSP